MRNTQYEIYNAKYIIRNMQYEIYNTKYTIRKRTHTGNPRCAGTHRNEHTHTLNQHNIVHFICLYIHVYARTHVSTTSQKKSKKKQGKKSREKKKSAGLTLCRLRLLHFFPGGRPGPVWQETKCSTHVSNTRKKTLIMWTLCGCAWVCQNCVCVCVCVCVRGNVFHFSHLFSFPRKNFRSHIFEATASFPFSIRDDLHMCV